MLELQLAKRKVHHNSEDSTVAEADPLSRSQTCRSTTHHPAQDQPSVGPDSELSAKYDHL